MFTNALIHCYLFPSRRFECSVFPSASTLISNKKAAVLLKRAYLIQKSVPPSFCFFGTTQLVTSIASNLHNYSFVAQLALWCSRSTSNHCFCRPFQYYRKKSYSSGSKQHILKWRLSPKLLNLIKNSSQRLLSGKELRRNGWMAPF